MTSKNAQQRWQNCLNTIQANVTEEQFATWFRPMVLLEFSEKDQKVVLGIPSIFFKEYVEGHFVKVFSMALRENFGHTIHLYYKTIRKEQKQEEVFDRPIEADTKTAQLKQERTQQEAFDSQLNPQLRFDNFIEGESNKLCCSVGKAIAEHPSQSTFNPLFIYGPSGVGKTHLVNAIGTHLSELYPDKRVLFVSAHTFQVQYTESIRQNKSNDFIHFYQGIHTLIIDDIQEFAGMKGTLNAFFHIFNHLKQNGRQIIITSDRMPSELQGIEDRLLTRFNWGLTAEMTKPDKGMRQAILIKKVTHDGLNIPRNVIDYVAENVSDSVRELEGVVNSLIAHAIVYNRDIDLGLAERVLHHAVRLDRKPITLDEIMRHTCAAMHVSADDIYSRSRKANIALARQVVMYFAQKLTNLSISRIGNMVGNRNHATVIHSISTVKDKVSVDKKFAESLSNIEEALRQHRPVETE